MDITDRINEIAERVRASVPTITSLDELHALEAETVGKKSAVAEARRSLGQAAPEERKRLGALINEVADEAGRLIADRRRFLEREAEAERLAADRLDMTLPGRLPPLGSLHVVTETMDEIVDIFLSLGYTTTKGPEVETAWYNFDALNTPPSHPARLEWDTIYVDHGDDPEGVMLRTHTSPLQARFMEAHEPPAYVVAPGRVYRNDAVDATHMPVFHQVEGLAVDTDITFADLRGTLVYLARHLFGGQRKLRLLPNHFRFTEPSAEGHVDCFNCDGSGCRVCGHTGWIELFGCGMVHPAVLEAVGYDPGTLSGFAFGLGADRAAMIRHGISDLRNFVEGDVRVLEQFR